MEEGGQLMFEIFNRINQIKNSESVLNNLQNQIDSKQKELQALSYSIESNRSKLNQISSEINIKLEDLNGCKKELGLYQGIIESDLRIDTKAYKKYLSEVSQNKNKKILRTNLLK